MMSAFTRRRVHRQRDREPADQPESQVAFTSDPAVLTKLNNLIPADSLGAAQGFAVCARGTHTRSRALFDEFQFESCEP